MLIEKEYRFYAAHRNETLDDKCRNLHGHRYGVKCVFRVHRDGSLTTLFGDFDSKIEPWLKTHYDHGMLINEADPLLPYLEQYMDETGDRLKLNRFDGPTSVENLAFKLFGEIVDFGFELERLEIRETDTSVVVYDRADWIADQRLGVEGRTHRLAGRTV
ncbi:MAG TPA: 6-carboxytetrahydropterin synthase [Pirellulaceae bacterium]|nr:6-carboxytetrahydropterin synthase [Pirellulaceae bacterium]